MADRMDPCTLVVYVAYAAFGDEPIRSFVRSYLDHPAGRPHRLMFALKGFGSAPPNPRDYGAPPGTEAMMVPDSGFDLGTYRRVVEQVVAPRYCLLNSRSRIMADNWLALLDDALADPGVAVAGATGSRQSLFSDHLATRYLATEGSWLRRSIRRSPVNSLRHRLRYPPFPNPHLRTNALLIDRATMLDLWPTTFRTKLDTARFENGRDNLTRRVARSGRHVVVVGRAGIFLEQDWASSETFWNGEQANLLVADNQTDRYTNADAAGRRELAAAAWREQAASRT